MGSSVRFRVRVRVRVNEKSRVRRYTMIVRGAVKYSSSHVVHLNNASFYPLELFLGIVLGKYGYPCDTKA